MMVMMVMMTIIRRRTELAPMMTFLLLFWIILVTELVVDGEEGVGLTPEMSIFMIGLQLILKLIINIETKPVFISFYFINTTCENIITTCETKLCMLKISLVALRQTEQM